MRCWVLGGGHAHLLLRRQLNEGIESSMPRAWPALRSTSAAAPPSRSAKRHPESSSSPMHVLGLNPRLNECAEVKMRVIRRSHREACRDALCMLWTSAAEKLGQI